MYRSTTGSVEFRDENYIHTSVICDGDIIFRVFCIPELTGSIRNRTRTEVRAVTPTAEEAGINILVERPRYVWRELW